jgi:glycolate oxidase FAD binding subunit
MADTLKPRDGKEVEDVVRWALDNDKPLELAGNGTKYGIGRPSQTDLTLDLSGLAGVTLYEPAELVLSARAGTPISAIEVLLNKHNQELAFEPIDYGPLLGAETNSGTLGGVIAANLSGPRRIKSGAARDHFLGVTAVTGRGNDQVRWPRREECYRLRPLQAVRRIMGHARRHDRHYGQGAAESGNRGDGADRRS